MTAFFILRYGQWMRGENPGYGRYGIIVVMVSIILLSNSAASQTDNDSLYSIWNDQNKEPIERLKAVESILTDYYSIIFFQDINSAEILSERQLQLAQEVDDTFYIVKGMMHIVDVLMLKSQSQETRDSLITEGYIMAEAANNKESRYDVLIAHAYSVFHNNDYVQSYKLYSEALKMAEGIDDKERQAYCYSEMAHKAYWAKNPDRSVELYKKARQLHEEMGNESDHLWASVNIARAYYFMGEHQTARRLLEEMKESAYELPDSSLLATIYLQLSWNYSKEKNYQEAIVNASKALDINETIDARRFSIKAIMAKLAEYYLLAGNRAEALQALEALISINPVSDGVNYTHHSINIGNLYIKMGESQKAIDHCREAERVAKQKNNFINLKNACECLYKAYALKGYKAKAYDYLFRFNEYVDSIDIQNQAKDLLFKELQREILEDSLKVINKNRQVELSHQEEIHRKNQVRNWSMTGGLLALLLAGGFYSRYRYVNKAKAIIEEQKRRVEQSEKYKEQFLANMSHELRTPMHAISGMTKILERNEHPDFQEPYLNAIRTSSDNLVVILNDVLDMSKIEAGKLQIESIPMSPKAVTENVVGLLRYKAEEKGIELIYDVDQGIPDMVMGDPTRLSQILTNLAGNGIKFTEKGKVHIGLTATEDELKFKVTDTGIGIPGNKLPFIFRMFEQSDKSINRRYGGTGLGLSISQQLAELMGGKIEVESEVGAGSTFYLTLPVVQVAEEAGNQLSGQVKLEEMAASLKGLKILLAEDNAFNQMIARDDLNYYIKDVQIDIADNGAVAVEKYRTGEYDIILMDAQMPEMDGMEATRRIRELEDESGHRTPIIAMTASLLRSEIDQYLGSGMDNYIPKPYQAEQLIGTIYAEMKSE